MYANTTVTSPGSIPVAVAEGTHDVEFNRGSNNSRDEAITSVRAMLCQTIDPNSQALLESIESTLMGKGEIQRPVISMFKDGVVLDSVSNIEEFHNQPIGTFHGATGHALTTLQVPKAGAIFLNLASPRLPNNGAQTGGLTTVLDCYYGPTDFCFEALLGKRYVTIPRYMGKNSCNTWELVVNIDTVDSDPIMEISRLVEEVHSKMVLVAKEVSVILPSPFFSALQTTESDLLAINTQLESKGVTTYTFNLDGKLQTALPTSTIDVRARRCLHYQMMPSPCYSEGKFGTISDTRRCTGWKRLNPSSSNDKCLLAALTMITDPTNMAQLVAAIFARYRATGGWIDDYYTSYVEYFSSKSLQFCDEILTSLAGSTMLPIVSGDPADISTFFKKLATVRKTPAFGVGFRRSASIDDYDTTVKKLVWQNNITLLGSSAFTHTEAFAAGIPILTHEVIKENGKPVSAHFVFYVTTDKYIHRFGESLEAWKVAFDNALAPFNPANNDLNSGDIVRIAIGGAKAATRINQQILRSLTGWDTRFVTVRDTLEQLQSDFETTTPLVALPLVEGGVMAVIPFNTSDVDHSTHSGILVFPRGHIGVNLTGTIEVKECYNHDKDRNIQPFSTASSSVSRTATGDEDAQGVLDTDLDDHEEHFIKAIQDGLVFVNSAHTGEPTSPKTPPNGSSSKAIHREGIEAREQPSGTAGDSNTRQSAERTTTVSKGAEHAATNGYGGDRCLEPVRSPIEDSCIVAGYTSHNKGQNCPPGFIATCNEAPIDFENLGIEQRLGTSNNQSCGQGDLSNQKGSLPTTDPTEDNSRSQKQNTERHDTGDQKGQRVETLQGKFFQSTSDTEHVVVSTSICNTTQENVGSTPVYDGAQPLPFKLPAVATETIPTVVLHNPDENKVPGKDIVSEDRTSKLQGLPLDFHYQDMAQGERPNAILHGVRKMQPRSLRQPCVPLDATEHRPTTTPPLPKGNENQQVEKDSCDVPSSEDSSSVTPIEENNLRSLLSSYKQQGYQFHFFGPEDHKIWVAVSNACEFNEESSETPTIADSRRIAPPLPSSLVRTADVLYAIEGVAYPFNLSQDQVEWCIVHNITTKERVQNIIRNHSYRAGCCTSEVGSIQTPPRMDSKEMETAESVDNRNIQTFRAYSKISRELHWFGPGTSPIWFSPKDYTWQSTDIDEYDPKLPWNSIFSNYQPLSDKHREHIRTIEDNSSIEFPFGLTYNQLAWLVKQDVCDKGGLSSILSRHGRASGCCLRSVEHKENQPCFQDDSSELPRSNDSEFGPWTPPNQRPYPRVVPGNPERLNTTSTEEPTEHPSISVGRRSENTRHNSGSDSGRSDRSNISQESRRHPSRPHSRGPSRPNTPPPRPPTRNITPQSDGSRTWRDKAKLYSVFAANILLFVGASLATYEASEWVLWYQSTEGTGGNLDVIFGTGFDYGLGSFQNIDPYWVYNVGYFLFLIKACFSAVVAIGIQRAVNNLLAIRDQGDPAPQSRHLYSVRRPTYTHAGILLCVGLSGLLIYAIPIGNILLFIQGLYAIGSSPYLPNRLSVTVQFAPSTARPKLDGDWLRARDVQCVQDLFEFDIDTNTTGQINSWFDSPPSVKESLVRFIVGRVQQCGRTDNNIVVRDVQWYKGGAVATVVLSHTDSAVNLPVSPQEEIDINPDNKPTMGNTAAWYKILTMPRSIERVVREDCGKYPTIIETTKRLNHFVGELYDYSTTKSLSYDKVVKTKTAISQYTNPQPYLFCEGLPGLGCGTDTAIHTTGEITEDMVAACLKYKYFSPTTFYSNMANQLKFIGMSKPTMKHLFDKLNMQFNTRVCITGHKVGPMCLDQETAVFVHSIFCKDPEFYAGDMCLAIEDLVQSVGSLHSVVIYDSNCTDSLTAIENNQYPTEPHQVSMISALDNNCPKDFATLFHVKSGFKNMWIAPTTAQHVHNEMGGVNDLSECVASYIGDRTKHHKDCGVSVVVFSYMGTNINTFAQTYKTLPLQPDNFFTHIGKSHTMVRIRESLAAGGFATFNFEKLDLSFTEHNYANYLWFIFSGVLVAVGLYSKKLQDILFLIRPLLAVVGLLGAYFSYSIATAVSGGLLLWVAVLSACVSNLYTESISLSAANRVTHNGLFIIIGISLAIRARFSLENTMFVVGFVEMLLAITVSTLFKWSSSITAQTYLDFARIIPFEPYTMSFFLGCGVKYVIATVVEFVFGTKFYNVAEAAFFSIVLTEIVAIALFRFNLAKKWRWLPDYSNLNITIMQKQVPTICAYDYITHSGKDTALSTVKRLYHSKNVSKVEWENLVEFFRGAHPATVYDNTVEVSQIIAVIFAGDTRAFFDAISKKYYQLADFHSNGPLYVERKDNASSRKHTTIPIEDFKVGSVGGPGFKTTRVELVTMAIPDNNSNTPIVQGYAVSVGTCQYCISLATDADIAECAVYSTYSPAAIMTIVAVVDGNHYSGKCCIIKGKKPGHFNITTVKHVVPEKTEKIYVDYGEGSFEIENPTVVYTGNKATIALEDWEGPYLEMTTGGKIQDGSIVHLGMDPDTGKSAFITLYGNSGTYLCKTTPGCSGAPILTSNKVVGFVEGCHNDDGVFCFIDCAGNVKRASWDQQRLPLGLSGSKEASFVPTISFDGTVYCYRLAPGHVWYSREKPDSERVSDMVKAAERLYKSKISVIATQNVTYMDPELQAKNERRLALRKQRDEFSLEYQDQLSAEKKAMLAKSGLTRVSAETVRELATRKKQVNREISEIDKEISYYKSLSATSNAEDNKKKADKIKRLLKEYEEEIRINKDKIRSSVLGAGSGYIKTMESCYHKLNALEEQKAQKTKELEELQEELYKYSQLQNVDTPCLDKLKQLNKDLGDATLDYKLRLKAMQELGITVQNQHLSPDWWQKNDKALSLIKSGIVIVPTDFDFTEEEGNLYSQFLKFLVDRDCPCGLTNRACESCGPRSPLLTYPSARTKDSVVAKLMDKITEKTKMTAHSDRKLVFLLEDSHNKIISQMDAIVQILQNNGTKLTAAEKTIATHSFLVDCPRLI